MNERARLFILEIPGWVMPKGGDGGFKFGLA